MAWDYAAGGCISKKTGAEMNSSRRCDPGECLRIAQQLIPLLVADAYSTKVFSGRWQTIRAKLEQLQGRMRGVERAESALVRELLPNIVSTLEEGRELAKSCAQISYSGKLLMQSHVDVVVAKLNLHLRDLYESGVLRGESNAIVVSWPGPGASRDDVVFFVKDLFARLHIGNTESKHNALDSLIHFLRQDPKNVIAVAEEGDIGYLVQLLDSNVMSILEQSSVAMSILANTYACKARLVAEGVIAPLIRLLESESSNLAKESIAASLQRLTVNSENACTVSAYGGVSALINVCRCGSPVAQAMAAGTLKNVASAEEIRDSMAEEGAIPVLINLINSGTELAQEFSTESLHILAARDERMRQLIVREGGIQSLVSYLKGAETPRAQENAFRAIHSLSESLWAANHLMASGFLRHLAFILKSGQSTVQQLAASTICNLSRTDGIKKALGEAGCIPLLVKMLDTKPSLSQETAAQALSSLLLVQTNRKAFIKDDENVACLVQLLDPDNQTVLKKFPISALLALSGSNSCRKKIAIAGACKHLERLAQMEVAGAEKILRKIAGNRLLNIFSRKWRHQLAEISQIMENPPAFWPAWRHSRGKHGRPLAHFYTMGFVGGVQRTQPPPNQPLV